MTLFAGIELHIDLSFSELNKGETELYLSNIVSSQANLLFKQSTEIHVSLSDGSIRAIILISGSLYAAICGYGSFRSGIDYLINDTRLLKEFTKSTLIKNGLHESDIIDISRVKGVPDKIRLVLLSVERLENKQQNLSPEEYKKELNKILASVNNIIRLMNKDDAQLLLSQLSDDYIPQDCPVLHSDKAVSVLCREEDIYPFIPLVSHKKHQN